MKTLTWQKPGQQNVAQELIKIIINYVAELRLNIPSDRIPSAKWIYQLMLLSTVLTIQTVPYNAIINAHENMRYLSIIGVFQTLMKLVIALIVVHVYTDKLILYGILTTFVSLIFMIILQIYCHRNYSECTYSIHKYTLIPLIRILKIQ